MTGFAFMSEDSAVNILAVADAMETKGYVCVSPVSMYVPHHSVLIDISNGNNMVV